MNPLAYLTAAGGAALGAAVVWLFMTLVTVPNAETAARNGYVLLSEKTAAEAKADELERQRNAAALALTDYQKRATADQQNLKVANDNLESIIAADHCTDGSACWTADDLDWLRAHGSKAQ